MIQPICAESAVKHQANRQNVITSASVWLERLVFEMTCNVLMGSLNPTRSLIWWPNCCTVIPH